MDDEDIEETDFIEAGEGWNSDRSESFWEILGTQFQRVPFWYRHCSWFSNFWIGSNPEVTLSASLKVFFHKNPKKNIDHQSHISCVYHVFHVLGFSWQKHVFFINTAGRGGRPGGGQQSGPFSAGRTCHPVVERFQVFFIPYFFTIWLWLTDRHGKIHHF